MSLRAVRYPVSDRPLAVYLCITIILGLGSLLFYKVFGFSHKYGQQGLMKRNARRYVPTYLKFKPERFSMKNAEDIFPIYKVEHQTLLSAQGDLTIAYEVTLPELFTLSNEEYIAFHRTWVKAIKLLPKHSIFHKQGGIA